MQRNLEEEAYTEARRVLRSLLLGSDPITHGKLSAECIVMQAETKTALALGVEALQMTQWVRRWRGKKREGMTSVSSAKRVRTEATGTVQLPARARAGESWSVQEDRQIEMEFKNLVPIATMAAKHMRTRGAISARLVHLGLAPSKGDARAYLRR